ncbi:angiopoietin-1 receptor-like [Antedon mediterranea]|uniref:angiopoietin-1 receptor-like n=1 Tax=Antedon mediterranea TaxID=105859 RepID=UPI003AF975D0
MSWNVPGDKVHERYVVVDDVGMGVYYCQIADNEITTIVQTTKIRDDAIITPDNSKNTVTVNVGDDVTIRFYTDFNNTLVWRKDGSTPLKIGTEKSMTFNPVETSDAGVYEMHQSGTREDRMHSFIKLIVRECPNHKWDPPDCTGDCEYCYNGGICDDKTGLCICAPGFKGATCEIECGGNKHGWNCENICSSKLDLNRCRYFQFCLPDPYGCSCVTGYKGLKCDTECTPGTFGADCAQTCHCKQGGCDRYTGICTDTQDSSCAYPWMGSNCQRILNTTFISANNGHSTTASCSFYYADAYKIEAIIMVINDDITENITTPLETKRDDQNILTHTFSVIADYDSVYICVTLQGGVSTQSVIFSEIFRLPVYNDSLTILDVSSSFIAIEWMAWNNTTDDGDGPVVGYFLYHKLSNTNDWKKTFYENSLSGNVSELMWDTEYTFGVSAVRPGEGGEGKIGNKGLTAKTLCGRPSPVQNVKHRVLTTESESVEVTWIGIVDVQSLKCFSKTFVYNVYLKVANNEGYREEVYQTHSNLLTIDNIAFSDSYDILVTVSNKDSESISVKSLAELTNECENTCNSGGIVGGTLFAGVCIGVLSTIMILLGKQRIRTNMCRSDSGDDPHAQHQSGNINNDSSSSGINQERPNLSKSDVKTSNELHVYYDYENEGNNIEYSTCDNPTEESVYALPDDDPEESFYVN